MRTLDFCPVSFFFFSSPNLSSRSRVDVYHTSTHGVALVRLARNTGCKNDVKKSPSQQHRTTLLGYIFATKAYIGHRKTNLFSSNTSSTCACNMVNFGPLSAEIGSGVWGTPANCNGFCVLAALLHGSLVVGISETLRR